MKTPRQDWEKSNRMVLRAISEGATCSEIEALQDVRARLEEELERLYAEGLTGECLWCYEPARPGRFPLCPGCDAANSAPATKCKLFPEHLDTLGPECAECASERRRVEPLLAEQQQHLDQMLRLREGAVAEIKSGKPWPGMNFGKAHYGMMIDGVIADTEQKIATLKKRIGIT